MIRDRLREKLGVFKDHCRKNGLRITPQRIAIYEALIRSNSHPSATEIYEQIKHDFPHVSLATVNNTLITFANIGLARTVEASGDPKRFDPDTGMHHHFRCIKCNKIIDFQDTSYDNIAIPKKITKKYLVLGKKVHLEGVCDICQKKQRRSHAAR